MIESYPWLDLVDVRVASSGEWVIHRVLGIIQEEGDGGGVCPVVKPNNAYDVYRLKDLKIPDGHEPDGITLKDAYGPISVRDLWLGVDGKVYIGLVNSKAIIGDRSDYRLRLRKIAPKTKRYLVSAVPLSEVAEEGHLPGRQLEVPPDAKGIPFDEWLKRQPLCEPGAIAKWNRDRDAAINAKAALRKK